MKKLMITLSAAALATSVFADEGTPTMYQTTEGFETYAAETVIKTATPTEAEGTTMLWYSAGADGETGTVKAYGETDGKLNGAGNNYLNVETTTGTPLYRKLVAHNAGELVNQDSDRVDIGDGIYVDTYVQFTASEEAPAEIADSKLVVWVKETVDEEAGTSTKDLMVMAGQLNASGVPTAQNFVIDTTGMDLTGWHRLTIRAMVAREDGQNSIAAFTLFLDGDQLAAKATQVPGKDAVVDEGGVEVEPAVDPVTYETLMGAYAVANLSAEAQEFYKNKQLFYSLVGTDQSGIVKQISAVGFDGSGQIDNVTTTTAAPDGISRGYFTITWDEGVESFVVKNGEDEVYSSGDLSDKTEAVFLIPMEAEQLTVEVTTKSADYSVVGDGIINLANTRSYDIETKTTLAFVNGIGYTEFSEALAAAKTSGKLLELKANVEIIETVEISGEDKLYIDLKGKTITFNGETPYEQVGLPFCFIVTSETAELSIVSTESEGKILLGDKATAASAGILYTSAGTTTLGNNTDDQGVVYAGLVMGYDLSMQPKATIYKGKFDATCHDDGMGGFILQTVVSGVIDENSAVTNIKIDDVDYYEVTPSAGGEEPEPEEPTTFKVTVTEAANATYTVTGADNLDAVAENTELTFTATAAEGYEYTSVPDGWEIAEDGTATCTVIVTGETPVNIPEPTKKVVTFDVRVIANNKVDCTSVPETLTGLTAGDKVTIIATAKTGYTYDGFTAADGWSFDGQTATYTATVNANLDVTIPVPALIVPVPGAEAPQYATEEDANTAAAKMDVSAADKALGIDKNYFKTTVTGSDAAGWTVTTELNAEVVQPSTETAVKAIPEAIAAAAEGAEIIVTVPDVKAGLQYVVEVVTELSNLGKAENLEGKTWTRAGTDGSLALPVMKPTGGKGFFKVHVKH